jgi:hypothetical protein
VKALQESHGSTAAALLDIHDNLPATPRPSWREMPDLGSPQNMQDLIRENEKLKELLQSSMSNLPPVPDNESISQIKKFQVSDFKNIFISVEYIFLILFYAVGGPELKYANSFDQSRDALNEIEARRRYQYIERAAQRSS